MLKRLSHRFTLYLFVGDLLLTLLALAAARQLRLMLPFGMQIDPLTGESLSFDIDGSFCALVLIVWAVVFLVLPVYNPRRLLHFIDEAQITLVAIAFAGLILAGLAYFFYREFSRVMFVYFTLIDALFLFLWRAVLWALRRQQRITWPWLSRRVLIVGAGNTAVEVALRISHYAWTGLQLVGFLDHPSEPVRPEIQPVLGSVSDAHRVVTQSHIDEVLIALPLYAQQDLIQLIADLQNTAVGVHVVPDLFDLAFVRTGIENLDGIPIVRLHEPAMTPLQHTVKRAFDLVIASIALAVCAIPMLLIAIAIKRDSPGPVIFRQQRIGEKGALFWMFKFRTMVHDADLHVSQVTQHQADGQIFFKRSDDPRLTRLGRRLRQLSLDELPQLFNVLKGEMSLVGPRPELPWLAAEYADWQRKRFNVPQGMTGWWQVNGRSNKPTLAKTRDDLYYIQNYSLLLDIVILWKTLWVVIRRKGAY